MVVELMLNINLIRSTYLKIIFMSLAGWLCFSQVMATTVLADCPPQLLVAENGLDMRDFPQVTITLRLIDSTCAFTATDIITITEEMEPPQGIKPILQKAKIMDLALTLVADLEANDLDVGRNVLQQLLAFLEKSNKCADDQPCYYNQATLLVSDAERINKFTTDAEAINLDLNRPPLFIKYKGDWDEIIARIVKDSSPSTNKYHAIIRVTSDDIRPTLTISAFNSTTFIYTLSVKNGKANEAEKLAQPIIEKLQQQYVLSYQSHLLPNNQPQAITLTTIAGTQIITVATLKFPVNDQLGFAPTITTLFGPMVLVIVIWVLFCLILLLFFHYRNLNQIL